MGRPGNPDRRAGHQGLTKQQIQGDRAEEIAFQLLQRKGWVLLDRNWSCRWGGIGSSAAERSTLVGCGGERSDGSTA